MQTEIILDKLKNEGLKITPQRVIILTALHSLKKHPTIQQVIDTVHEKNPNISVATIYKTLDTLVEKGVIAKFSKSGDVTRYDIIVENHHHIYTNDNNKIEDYVNAELDRLLLEFFRINSIPNLEIESIEVNISGRYIK